MSDTTKKREPVESKGNAGFFGNETKAASETELPKASATWNFTRGHVRTVALIFTIAFLATVGFGIFNLGKMNEASTAAGEYQTVNARVISAEKDGSSSQKLEVLWGYDNNSKVTATDVISAGSPDKYVAEDMVSVMYIPSEFDKNTPAENTSRFLSEQYDQVNVATYLPFIIMAGILAFIVLLSGIITLVFMNRNVVQNETWGTV